MSEPTSPDPPVRRPGDGGVGEAEHLHPLFLLTGLGGSLRGMAGGYAFIGYLAVSGRAQYALLAALALLLVLVVGLFLYWVRFEYRVGENEIRIDSGILSRTHRSIPFDRIQDVELSQGPVARLLGLARVKFETGGSGDGNADEGSLHAIALDRAQHIRSLIRDRRQLGAGAIPVHADEEVEPVYAMDVRRLLLAGLFGFSLAVFAGLFGLTQTLGDVLGFDPLAPAFWRSLVSPDNPIAAFALANRAGAAVSGVLLLLLVGAATGIVRSVLRDYGFRLDRVGSGLRRRRGLLTKSDVTVAAERAQAAAAGSGPLRASFGWQELRLQSLARDEGGKSDHILAPLARDPEIGAILKALGWRAVPDDAAWRRISKSYVWTLLLGLTPLYLAAIVLAGALSFALTATDGATKEVVMAELTPLGVLLGATLTAIAAAATVRILAWRRTRYAVDGDRLLIRTGWWRRRLLILPVRRIQSIDFRQSFVERWFGTAALKFGVAGASGFAVHAIPALAAEKARTLRADLLRLDHDIRTGGGAVG